MGDLHLEVVLSRLRREYHLDVSMGPLLTSHKEMPDAGHECRAAAVSTGLSIFFSYFLVIFGTPSYSSRSFYSNCF